MATVDKVMKPTGKMELGKGSWLESPRRSSIEIETHQINEMT